MDFSLAIGYVIVAAPYVMSSKPLLKASKGISCWIRAQKLEEPTMETS